MFKISDNKPVIASKGFNVIESLDGLNSGVPTRTTATLTPTTLRNIEQTFQECQDETHQNQARFVPPLVQPSSQGNKQKKRKQAGLSCLLNTFILYLLLDIFISPEEEERRAVRRERNKLAAARCRKRRLDHTNELMMETEGLQVKKKDLEKDILELEYQKKELQYLLDNHKPCCFKMNKDIKTSDDPKNFFNGKENDVTCAKISTLKRSVGKRPTTLLVPTSFPPVSIPTEVDGVPITTPTAGIPFNFESIMEGGTGLTPVSGPLIPSCATQQRNAGCVDLSSPDSSKLVSL
ncbi:Putative Transcription factor kayak [Halyomorpha halys]|nr:Putative Transcription factor kayak [Halyomorpha halys]